MTASPSELAVITKAKDLCSYVITITQRSPKQFRFTFVTRMQNLALDAIEHLYRANDVFASKEDPSSCRRRADLQHDAMTDLRLLAYVAQLAMEQQCILPKQFEQIARQEAECARLLGAWINSDKRRFQ